MTIVQTLDNDKQRKGAHGEENQEDRRLAMCCTKIISLDEVRFKHELTLEVMNSPGRESD